MGYDISNWKTVKLEDLSFPIEALYDDLEKRELKEYVTVEVDPLSGIATIKFTYTTEIKGRFQGDRCLVTSVKCEDEGSGHDMENFLKPLLKLSKGTLIADCVWEGGDDMSQERFVNGEYGCGKHGTAVEDISPELFLFALTSSSQGVTLGSISIALAATPEEAVELITERQKLALGAAYDEDKDPIQPEELSRYSLKEKRAVMLWDGDY